MSASSERHRLARGDAQRDGFLQRVVEILAIGKRGQRVGQALVAHGFETDLELTDFLPGSLQALLQPGIILLHGVRRRDQRLDDQAQAVAVLRGAEVLRRGREAIVVVRR